MKYNYEEEDHNIYKYEDNNRYRKEEEHKCRKEEEHKCRKEEEHKCRKEEEHKCKEDGCHKIIKKEVSLVAQVKVKPIICIPEIEVKCIGPVHLVECKKHEIKKECEFCIKQDLTLRIPVRFDADTEVKEQGIVCHPEDHCRD